MKRLNADRIQIKFTILQKFVLPKIISLTIEEGMACIFYVNQRSFE